MADIDADGDIELIAATEYHWWFGISSEGQKKWQHNTVLGPGVNHVATARQQSGQHLVAFGCRDGTVQVVDGDGKLQFVLPTADVVTGLGAVDVDGDGSEEILVSSAIGNSYAVKADGSHPMAGASPEQARTPARRVKRQRPVLPRGRA